MARMIVAGVDNSSAALAAAHWAAREALSRDARLLLLHAVPPLPGRTTLVTPTDPAPRPAGRRWTPFGLADELREQYPNLSLTADEVTGQPVQALVDAARKAELLVLGSHGAGRVAGFLIGSVALGAAARAPMPVVLIRPGTGAVTEHLPAGDGSPSTQAPYRDVVLGLNLTSPNERVVGFAFEEADRRSAALRVIHGWTASRQHGHGNSLEASGPGPLSEDALLLDEALAPWHERYPRTELSAETVVGDADRHLLDAASEASLLVIGRRNRASAVRPRSGSTTRSVLRRSAVPVAVVPMA